MLTFARNLNANVNSPYPMNHWNPCGSPRLSPVLICTVVETPSQPCTWTSPKYGCKNSHVTLESVVHFPSGPAPAWFGKSKMPSLLKSQRKKMIVGSFDRTEKVIDVPSNVVGPPYGPPASIVPDGKSRVAVGVVGVGVAGASVPWVT